MSLPDPTQARRFGRFRSVTMAAIAGAAAVCLMLPASVAYADPEPAPPAPAPAEPAPPGAPAPPPPPADPNAPPPPPADPNAPPADPNAPPPPPADPNAPPADPNAPPPPAGDPSLDDPARVQNAEGGFSFIPPAGWVVGDASRLNYGQALLTKEVPPPLPGQPAPAPANDTSILLGRLDLKLFAGAEPDNAKAAVRLASDMGEFFMPFPGTRINQATGTLDAGGMQGSSSYYEVKFTDEAKPDGQIWSGVVGDAPANAPRGQRNERWFVVWLGTGNDPVDQGAAEALANSIRPWTPPPAPEPDPNAPPPPPAEGDVPGRAQVGVPVPVENPDPAMLPPA